MFTRILFLIILLSISISSLFAAIRLPWGIDEAIDTGFIAPKSGSKDVITPEGCRTISGVGVTKDYFVPTKTTTEWDAFKANIPTGITIGSCSIPTYSWSIGGSVDTDTCSSGQVRSVTCKRSDGQVVSQLYCNPTTKPSTVVTGVSSIQRTTWAGGGSNGTFCANTIIGGNPAMMRNGSTVPQLFGRVSCANVGAYKPAAWQQADDLANYGTSVAFVQYAGHSLPSFPPPFDPGYTTGTSCYYIWTNHKCITYNCDPITPPPAVTGSCGSANNVNTLTAPVSNLCNRGSSSIVTATGANWIWSCYGSNGGGNANCSALNAPPPPPPPPSIPGVCGTTGGMCTSGTATGDIGPISGMNNERTWTCLGQNGGANVSCKTCYLDKTAEYRGCFQSPINSQWGIADVYTTRSYSGFTETGYWAFAPTNFPRCGEPAFSCAYGIPPVPVNGSCSASPNTCTTGTPSGYNAGSCGGNQTWTCNGTNSGSSMGCTLTNPSCPPITYTNTQILTMGWALSNNIEWRINLRNTNSWWTMGWVAGNQFTKTFAFDPQTTTTMMEYAKVAVRVIPDSMSSADDRSVWSLPYQVQAPNIGNDWTTIWRVNRTGSGVGMGTWKMNMTTFTGTSNYMFVSLYKNENTLSGRTLMALGSTGTSYVNYNESALSWSKIVPGLPDCIDPSIYDTNGFCPPGWTPTKVIPTTPVCGGTGNNKPSVYLKSPGVYYYEPKYIMTQVCKQ